jgi:hypothetical protein
MEFHAPRGLRFVSNENLYCVARVVAFDFTSGEFLGTSVSFPRLYGQALAFFRSARLLTKASCEN